MLSVLGEDENRIGEEWRCLEDVSWPSNLGLGSLEENVAKSITTHES